MTAIKDQIASTLLVERLEEPYLTLPYLRGGQVVTPAQR